MSNETSLSLALRAPFPLHGSIQVPGDKSISHRALILASLAVGRSEIEGLLESEDTERTAAAMRAMGATITRLAPGRWEVYGVGVGSLLQPATALDMGNSGTSTRLLMGLVATHPINVTFTGDHSLSRRPMRRISAPLSEMGAETTTTDGHLPLTVHGLAPAIPIRYRLPVASAQVKSAILLAALNTPGSTCVEEPVPTRDHTERMLQGFGAELTVETVNGCREIKIMGPVELQPQDMMVPGDISSAAFPLVAALLVPGSSIEIKAVSINPTRDGLLHALRQMGAKITIRNERLVSGEPVADLLASHGPLQAIEADISLVPRMIDEYPVLFVAAALASGHSVIRGIEELRVKESDRIAVMAEGLRACGVPVEELPDGLIIEGAGGRPIAGGASISPELDHRIAMSFAVLSLVSEKPVTVRDRSPIATSFPTFLSLLQSLGVEECAPTPPSP